MRIRRYLLTTLLCFAPSVSAQQDAQPPKGSNILGQSQNELRTKLDSGRVIDSNDKGRYLFVPAEPTGKVSKEEPSRWTYGEKLPKPGEATGVVEVQIGVRDNKRVYLPVLIPKDKAESASKDINKIIEGTNPSWFGSQLNACSNGKECVKTCDDGKGGNYCCRWECTKDKQR